MAVLTLRATYTDQVNLEIFFGKLFGHGKASVLVCESSASLAHQTTPTRKFCLFLTCRK